MDRLWPLGAELDASGELWIGGCSARSLARTHGTPLYVYDELTLRTRMRAYRSGLAAAYPGQASAAYASKAYVSTALVQILDEEGFGLDVVSGGELYIALQAGFPPERIHFHGNNKTAEEMVEALDAGVGRIVVDNLVELEALAELTGRRGMAPAKIWLRLAPGIDPHTHPHISTGDLDTKFGLTISTGEAERAVAQALASPFVELLGLHAHIGSQIYDSEPLAAAGARLADFAADMRDRYGFVAKELSPGGGWGVPTSGEDAEAPLEPYIAAVSDALAGRCRAQNLPLPHLVLEPGRSLVAQAGVALYRVGTRKVIPGVRTYVAVDGGMADNIRPALYGAPYTAMLLAEPGPERSRPGVELEEVTVVGKFCESGDVLVRDIRLPRSTPGDLLAVPMAGAYTLSMASNYNQARRPAVVLAGEGHARLIQRRESYADLVARDVAYGANRPRFEKYHALGNDYIVLDPLDFPTAPGPELIRRLCDRHRGPGADGVLWGPAAPSEPFAVRLFNPDGSEFEKSGNGLRIFARYLWDRGLPPERDFNISTPGGNVTAHVLDDAGDTIALEMGRLLFESASIPASGPPREVVAENVEVGGTQYAITAANIGNPHCVLFMQEISSALARSLGPQFETHPLFPEKTNVQFAQVLDRHSLRIEIWERGAGYTLASGTSSCAAAGAAIKTGRCDTPITVYMHGGSMLVEVAAGWSVRLTGTVAPVCKGELSRALLKA